MIDIIELRWLDHGNRRVLQCRTRQLLVDDTGAIRGYGEWGEWKNVPTQDCY